MKVYKSPMDLGNELMKTYNQDSLDYAYKNFLTNHPEIVKWKKGEYGNYMDEGYMRDTMDTEFLKSLGHKGDRWSFEEANPGTKVLYSRLRALRGK